MNYRPLGSKLLVRIITKNKVKLGGMDITIATTARTDDEGRALLAAFGFPFRQENQ